MLDGLVPFNRISLALLSRVKTHLLGLKFDVRHSLLVLHIFGCDLIVNLLFRECIVALGILFIFLFQFGVLLLQLFGFEFKSVEVFFNERLCRCH